jgi:hypothetical protein
MKSCIALFVTLSFNLLLSAQPPAITSFSPASSPVGSVVTITGSNFNSNISNNIVYFGAVKAIITAASATSLTVTAPAGTTYAPLSVTTGGLTGYSSLPFKIVFSQNTTAFSPASFAAKVDFPTVTFPRTVLLHDFDGDGIADMAVVNQVSNYISVYKNTGSKPIPVFTAKTDYTTLKDPINISCTDLDGDGKPDLVVTIFNQGGEAGVSILKNISTNGNLLFQQGAYIPTGNGSVGLHTGDIDGDGKPDVAVTSSNSGKFSILRNISSIDNIAFAPIMDINYYRSDGIIMGDIDGDQKIDIALSNTVSNAVSVYRNTSLSGNVSFADPVHFNVGTYPSVIKLGDFDGDNKYDLAVVNYTGSSISILKNISTPGTVSFEDSIGITTVQYPQFLDVGDLDGDGKPEITFGNNVAGETGVLKNLSTGDAISFAPPVYYNTGNYQVFPFIGDVNGDGRPDIAVTNSLLNTVSILRNRIGEIIPIELCASPANTSLNANIAGLHYQWQLSTGAGFFDLINNDNYSGTSAATLQITNISSDWHGYQYRCVVDELPRDPYEIKFTNTWTGTQNNAWEHAANWSCGAVPLNSSNVIINSGTLNINTDVTINSLTMSPGVIINVKPGVHVTILSVANDVPN